MNHRVINKRTVSLRIAAGIGVFAMAILACMVLVAGNVAEASHEKAGLDLRDSLQMILDNEPPAFGSVEGNTLYVTRPLQRIGTELRDFTVGFVPVSDPDDPSSTLEFEVNVVADLGENTEAMFAVESSRSSADGVIIELTGGSVPFEFGQYGDGYYELNVTVSDGKDDSGNTDPSVDDMITLYLRYEKNSQPYFTAGRDGLLLFDADLTNGVYELRDSIPAVNIDCDGLTYSITGEDADDFSITPLTGALELTNTTTLQSSYSFTISVSDGLDYSGDADTSVDDSIEALVTRVAGAFDPNIHPSRPSDSDVLLTSTAEGQNGLGPLSWTDGLTAPTPVDMSIYIGADANTVSVHPDFAISLTRTELGTRNAKIRDDIWDMIANPHFPENGGAYLIAANDYRCARSGSSGISYSLLDNEPPVFGSGLTTSIIHTYDPSQGNLNIGEYEATDPEGGDVKLALRGEDSKHFNLISIGGIRHKLVPSDYPAADTYEIQIEASDVLGQVATLPVSIDWISDSAGMISRHTPLTGMGLSSP